MARKRLAKRTANPVSSITEHFTSKIKNNPAYADLKDLGTTVGVGIGAYSINRVGVMLIQKLLGQRVPILAKHLGPAASLGLAAIIWWVCERFDALRRHSNSAVVGSGVAVIQTLIQTYLPGMQWLFGAAALPTVRQPAQLDLVNHEQDLSISTSDTTLLPQNSSGSTMQGPVIDEDDFIAAVTDDEEEFGTGVFSRN